MAVAWFSKPLAMFILEEIEIGVFLSAKPNRSKTYELTDAYVCFCWCSSQKDNLISWLTIKFYFQ